MQSGSESWDEWLLRQEGTPTLRSLVGVKVRQGHGKQSQFFLWAGGGGIVFSRYTSAQAYMISSCTFDCEWTNDTGGSRENTLLKMSPPREISSSVGDVKPGLMRGVMEIQPSCLWREHTWMQTSPGVNWVWESQWQPHPGSGFPCKLTL